MIISLIGALHIGQTLLTLVCSLMPKITVHIFIYIYKFIQFWQQYSPQVVQWVGKIFLITWLHNLHLNSSLFRK